MAETTDVFSGMEPAENLGYVRLNWRGPPESHQPLVLLASAVSDAAVDFVEAFRAIGYDADVWQLDRYSTGVPRDRRSELNRLAVASSKAAKPWVAVIPFDRIVARLASRTFTKASFLLLSDDVAVLGVSEESNTSDIRSAILSSARVIAEMAIFATSATQPTMLISMRKAKEFPEVVLQALAEFGGVTPAEGELKGAAKVMGRPQLQVAAKPIQKALAVDSIRGGIEPVHKNGAITGWAKRSLSNERVSVAARIDGREIARTQADRSRQDLAFSGIGDGQHGFILDVSKTLTQTPVRVEVFAIDTGQLIGALEINAERGERVPLEGNSPVQVSSVAAE